MKTEKNILVAFLLNLSFSIFELIGGIFTNSIAIISDAIHDLGDAISIGLSYFLEKKSSREADDVYTYGYARYSILGAVITNTILIVGSVFVIFNAVKRIINPTTINYDGMIIFAIFGVIVNFIAAYFTKDGDSLNQKAVNLHMLEDVLGWIVVLVGAIVIKFTKVSIIDPIMSIFVAVFILVNAVKSYRVILDLFLEKVPSNISLKEIKEQLLNLEDVCDIYNIHIWSIDGIDNYATMHVISNLENVKELKEKIKEELEKYGIDNTTIEFEKEDDVRMNFVRVARKQCCCNHSHHYFHHH